MNEKIAEIVISISNVNVDKIYDYIVPDNIDIKEGTRVVVPFGVGDTKLCGYVVGIKDNSDYDRKKLKAVIQAIDETPIITKDMLEIARWMKEKYYTTFAKCLQCILPAGIKGKKTMSKKMKMAHLLAETDEECRHIEEVIEDYAEKSNLYHQQQALVLLYENGEMSVDEIRECLFISESPIKTLQKKGLINIYSKEIKRDVTMLRGDAFVEKDDITLNEEQTYAFNSLMRMMDSEQFNYALLHGITGSGKTEIYMRLIEETIRRGKQAIMLVPEISLTPQTVARFVGRFGDSVTVTHSKMMLGERYDQWKKALDGDVSIMIGPRSAVFAPFENIGVIIIDEEHESSYKSEITPKYDAKEVAAERLQISGGLLVLGSATPSIETFYKATTGEINLFRLTKRAKDSLLPQVTVADMRKEFLNGNRSIFSTLLTDEIKRCLDNKEQIILFLNRRGYASFVSCRRCGYVIKCDFCNVSYTYHKSEDKLMCHYCGARAPNPKNCPNCESTFIKQFGSGTQKVEHDINILFPEAKTIRMDMDTVAGKNSYETILNSFAEGEADILIGTQMIAKGHDFGNVTLVGIVAADISLNSGSYKSAETTFQLMTQVAGRAGRANIPGKVVAQTYNPEHYAIIHAQNHDYENFYREEINIREKMIYPPFVNLFVLLFTGENEKGIISVMHYLSKIMEHYKVRGDYELLGPAPCQISKIKKRYRWKIIVKSENEVKLKNFCIYCVERLRKSAKLDGINISLTLNPYDI